MTSADAGFPAPGSPVPGAPPALRRDGGASSGADRPARSARPSAAAAPTSVITAPAPGGTLAAGRLVAALAGTAAGLWLERRWRR